MQEHTADSDKSLYFCFYYIEYTLSSYCYRIMSRPYFHKSCIKLQFVAFQRKIKLSEMFFRGRRPSFHARTQLLNLSNLLPYFAQRLFILFLYSRWQIEYKSKHGRNGRIYARFLKLETLNYIFKQND